MIHALLVADGDGQVQHGGELAGLLGVARVGGDHDHVAHVQLLDDLGQHEGGVEVVHGALEEALQLLRVQIHGDEAVGSGQLHALRAHARTNGYAGFILLVALAIAEIGHDQRAGMGVGTLECVHPEQDLYEFVIGMQADGLHHQYITVTNRFVHADKRVAFRKGNDLGRAQLLAHVLAHALRKDLSAAAREDGNIRTVKHKSLHSFYHLLTCRT